MLSTNHDILDNGRIHKHAVLFNDSPLSYAEALGRFQDDEAFRSFLISILADTPFLGYRWETPAITADTSHHPFEFVLLNAPGLERPPDRTTFAAHFTTDAGIVAFQNLGKDATLVVPSPSDANSGYTHLAAFTRTAPLTQQHELWQKVGEVVQRQISDDPLWLSTAGGGVAWLHIRLDSRPKYYGYSPYRQAP